jgi:hypothetical protein
MEMWLASHLGHFTLGEKALPQYPFDRRLGGPPELIWIEEKNLLHLPGTESPF